MIRQTQSKHTISSIAENYLSYKGAPYSLAMYPMFRPILDSPHKRVVMKAGRQVSKTVTLAVNLLVRKLVTPYHRSIYCNVSQTQTKSFSTNNLEPILRESVALNAVLMDSKHNIESIFEKSFANGSSIKMTYIGDGGDRVRGEAAQELVLDEIQDMDIDSIIDVQECLAAQTDQHYMYAGTSKTISNELEYFWSISTKKEWIIQCTSCHKYNIPSIENIGELGLICKDCGTPLDTYKGSWHSTADSEIPPSFDGYHIPQIILPLHCNNPEKWDDLLRKKREYPENKFLNEIMGEPSGEGTSLISESILKSMCIPDLRMATDNPYNTAPGADYFVAGVDWGGGGVSGTSRTVFTITAVYAESKKYRIIYGKIFTSSDLFAIVNDIADTCNRLSVTYLYGDRGGGAATMSQLRAIIPHISIIPIQYCVSNTPLTWKQQGEFYLADRTTIIDNLILGIKDGSISCMCWEDFKPFAEEMLAVKECYAEDRRRMWVRTAGKADDSLHSLVFGYTGCRIHTGDLRFYN